MDRRDALLKTDELEKIYGNSEEIIRLKVLSQYIHLEDILKEFLKISKSLEIKGQENNSFVQNIGYAHASLDTGNLVDSNYTMYQSSKSHGYAAEKMNDMYDNISGKDAKIVGSDNAKNGADRMVDGTEIQTKFCATGKRCITECLDDNGNFKYIDSNGNPMKIEVPKDKYDEAVKALEEKIKSGKVPGVSDPRQAKEIVKKSPFTYEQAKNVAKFGTIESVTYDAVEGIKTAGMAMGISAAMSFAHSIWNGEDVGEALKTSCHVGIKVGGISWVSTIAAKQLARTSFQSTIRVGTDALARQIGPRVAANIVNASRSMTGGAAIYGGAAMKSFSKMMSGNIVTGVAMTVVLSSADVYRMCQGRASGKQVAKTVTKSGAGIAGGTGGMIAGAAAAAKIGAIAGSVVPGVGNLIGGAAGLVVGGLTGAFVGGAAAQKAVDVVLDDWLEIKDDIDEMMDIFNEKFSYVAFDYLLSDKEVEIVMSEIRKMDIPNEMRNMFESSDRNKYARNIIVPVITKIVKNRKKIILPNDEQILNSLEMIFA